MKKLIPFILFKILLTPFLLKANENFSVEIEALTLVMEQYKNNNADSEIELDLNNKNPSYMALKQDECHATVKVTEKTGIEIVNTELFDVNICKKQVNKTFN